LLERLAAALGVEADRIRRWAWAIAVDRRLQVAGSPAHAGLADRLDAIIDSGP
jgi:hypothetical protein